jgi:archaellum biogenesis ATPase FlaH
LEGTCTNCTISSNNKPGALTVSKHIFKEKPMLPVKYISSCCIQKHSVEWGNS